MIVADVEETYIPLSKAAEIAGYTDNATLRQAINRGKLRAEEREHALGFPYYVTRLDWFIEYLENRPHRSDGRLERVQAYAASEGALAEE